MPASHYFCSVYVTPSGGFVSRATQMERASGESAVTVSRLVVVLWNLTLLPLRLTNLPTVTSLGATCSWMLNEKHASMIPHAAVNSAVWHCVHHFVKPCQRTWQQLVPLKPSRKFEITLRVAVLVLSWREVHHRR